MPIAGVRETKSVGNSYRKSPLAAYAKAFSECAQSILKEDGYDIFEEPQKVYHRRDSKEAMKRFFVENCFDENNNCEGHAFLEGERSDEYSQEYLPKDKHLGNRADYEKMLAELKRSTNDYQIREWFFDIDDENSGTEIKCEYSTKGIPFNQYPPGHSQGASSSSKPNHTAKFFMNTGNRDKDVNSLIDALQHYIQ